MNAFDRAAEEFSGAEYSPHRPASAFGLANANSCDEKGDDDEMRYVSQAINLAGAMEALKQQRFSVEVRYEEVLTKATDEMAHWLADRCTTLGLDPVRIGMAAKEKMVALPAEPEPDAQPKPDAKAAKIDPKKEKRADRMMKRSGVKPADGYTPKGRGASAGPFKHKDDGTLLYSGKGPVPAWMRDKMLNDGVDPADKSKKGKEAVAQWKRDFLVAA